MRHNIIFLDVDGVLNNMAYFENGENVPEIDMTAVERLARFTTTETVRLFFRPPGGAFVEVKEKGLIGCMNIWRTAWQNTI